MIDYETGKPLQLITNPVPFILVNAGSLLTSFRGRMSADIAPTLFEIILTAKRDDRKVTYR